MKEFFEKLMNDDESGQKFTSKEMLVYGVLVPLGLFAIMAVAGWLETSCV